MCSQEARTGRANKLEEKLAEKWYREWWRTNKLWRGLDVYQQEQCNGLTNMKAGPPVFLDRLTQSRWKAEIIKVVRHCTKEFWIPFQNARLCQRWIGLRGVLVDNIEQCRRIERWDWEGDKVKAVCRGISNLNTKHSKEDRLRRGRDIVAKWVPPPPIEVVRKHGERGKERIEEEGKMLKRGGGVMPVNSKFRIEGRIGRRKDPMTVLAWAIFGCRRRENFIFRSMIKRLDMNAARGDSFRSRWVELKKGGRRRVTKYSQYRQILYNKRSWVGIEEFIIISALYQIQIRVFQEGTNRGVSNMICKEQIGQNYERGVDLLDREGEWELLCGEEEQRIEGQSKIDGKLTIAVKRGTDRIIEEQSIVSMQRELGIHRGKKKESKAIDKEGERSDIDEEEVEVEKFGEQNMGIERKSRRDSIRVDEGETRVHRAGVSLDSELEYDQVDLGDSIMLQKCREECGELRYETNKERVGEISTLEVERGINKKSIGIKDGGVEEKSNKEEDNEEKEIKEVREREGQEREQSRSDEDKTTVEADRVIERRIVAKGKIDSMKEGANGEVERIVDKGRMESRHRDQGGSRRRKVDKAKECNSRVNREENEEKAIGKEEGKTVTHRKRERIDKELEHNQEGLGDNTTSYNRREECRLQKQESERGKERVESRLVGVIQDGSKGRRWETESVKGNTYIGVRKVIDERVGSRDALGEKRNDRETLGTREEIRKDSTFEVKAKSRQETVGEGSERVREGDTSNQGVVERRRSNFASLLAETHRVNILEGKMYNLQKKDKQESNAEKEKEEIHREIEEDVRDGWGGSEISSEVSSIIELIDRWKLQECIELDRKNKIDNLVKGARERYNKGVIDRLRIFEDVNQVEKTGNRYEGEVQSDSNSIEQVDSQLLDNCVQQSIERERREDREGLGRVRLDRRNVGITQEEGYRGENRQDEWEDKGSGNKKSRQENTGRGEIRIGKYRQYVGQPQKRERERSERGGGEEGINIIRSTKIDEGQKAGTIRDVERHREIEEDEGGASESRSEVSSIIELIDRWKLEECRELYRKKKIEEGNIRQEDIEDEAVGIHSDISSIDLVDRQMLDRCMQQSAVKEDTERIEVGKKGNLMQKVSRVGNVRISTNEEDRGQCRGSSIGRRDKIEESSNNRRRDDTTGRINEENLDREKGWDVGRDREGDSIDNTTGESRSTTSSIAALFRDEQLEREGKKVGKKNITRRKVWERWKGVIRGEIRRKILREKKVEKQVEGEREDRKVVFDYTTKGLSIEEVKILGKGEAFCIVDYKIDEDRSKVDIYQYQRRLRLHEVFRDPGTREEESIEEIRTPTGRGESSMQRERQRGSNRGRLAAPNTQGRGGKLSMISIRGGRDQGRRICGEQSTGRRDSIVSTRVGTTTRVGSRGRGVETQERGDRTSQGRVRRRVSTVGVAVDTHNRRGSIIDPGARGEGSIEVIRRPTGRIDSSMQRDRHRGSNIGSLATLNTQGRGGRLSIIGTREGGNQSRRRGGVQSIGRRDSVVSTRVGTTTTAGNRGRGVRMQERGGRTNHVGLRGRVSTAAEAVDTQNTRGSTDDRERIELGVRGGRRLPSLYDPDSQNRNLHKYNSCIQEEIMLALGDKKVKFRDNVTKEERVALKTLKQRIEEKEIIITRADKGSRLVALDYEKYICKGTHYIDEEAKVYSKVQGTEQEIISRLTKERNLKTEGY